MAVIKIQRGQSVRWRMAITEQTVPVDLTGATWEVLEPKGDPIVTIAVTDALNGISHLIIDKDQTASLRKGRLIIRPRVIFPSGKAIASTPIEAEIT